MSKLSGRNTLLSMAGATAGVFLFAFSFCVFLRPLGLYSGGFTGIAQSYIWSFRTFSKSRFPEESTGPESFSGCLISPCSCYPMYSSAIAFSIRQLYVYACSPSSLRLSHRRRFLCSQIHLHRSLWEVPYPALEWV